MIFFIALLIVPCFTLRKKVDDNLIFDVRSTTCLKGILCLFVMFHNLGLDYYPNDCIQDLIAEHAGGVGVGLFFFLSAFGIIRSYQKKGNPYLKQLLFVHIPKIYFLSVAINLLTYFVFFRGNFETGDLIMRILNLDILNGFNRMNRHGWYISTIILLYLIFMVVYFICSKLKTEKRFIIAGIILACIATSLRIVAIIADQGGMYTREITAFSTGCLYATFFEECNTFFKKHFFPLIIISGIAMVAGFFFYEPLSTHMSAIFLVTLAQKFKWENSVTFVLGKICLGIYLFLHFSSMVLIDFIKNPYYWMLLNAGFILLLSFIAYGISFSFENLFRMIKKRIIDIRSRNKDSLPLA